MCNGLFYGSSHINAEPRGNWRLEAGVGPLEPSAIRGATRTGRVLFIASNALTPILCDERFLCLGRRTRRRRILRPCTPEAGVRPLSLRAQEAVRGRADQPMNRWTTSNTQALTAMMLMRFIPMPARTI